MSNQTEKEKEQNPSVEDTTPLQEAPPVVPQTESEETADPQEQLAVVQKELEAAKEELAKVKDQMLRTLAEYDNYRKRTQCEKERIYPDAIADAVMQILPVKDNLERSFACEGKSDSQAFVEGIHMVYNQLEEGLKKLGVEECGAVGDAFDPTIHNAVMHVEDENLGEQVICEVFQKGYRLKDKVIRHAMVKVAN